MRPWLTIVGIGDDGLDGLSPAARAAIMPAQVLVGGARHLAMVPDTGVPRLTWRTPLADTVDDIAAHRGERVVVLATGDPMCFGIGVTLARAFAAGEMAIIPAPSAFSLAQARLGWASGSFEALTLHGRPLETLRAFLAPGQRLLLLSHDGTTPAAIARLLVEAGYGASAITVLAHMGGGDETCIAETARAWPNDAVADFNTVAIECRGEGRPKRFHGAPGLPDRAFETDGQLTKREIRAQTLSALAPSPGALLWDVGAGSGSIAVEWLLADRRTEAIAIERVAARCAIIARNASALGVPRLTVQQGAAPEALELLPRPDAVFIGGGVSLPGVIETCWARLAPGGRLVANAVTIAGETALTNWGAAALATWGAETGVTLTRIAIARARPVGKTLAWRPLMPVTQLAAVKPDA